MKAFWVALARLRRGWRWAAFSRFQTGQREVSRVQYPGGKCSVSEDAWTGRCEPVGKIGRRKDLFKGANRNSTARPWAQGFEGWRKVQSTESSGHLLHPWHEFEFPMYIFGLKSPVSSCFNITTLQIAFNMFPHRGRMDDLEDALRLSDWDMWAQLLYLKICWE